MSDNTSFDIWWNSPKVKRVVGIMYSLGASIVIIGAMGKILHTSWGGYMLGAGMSVEAILFALGIFDKPFKEMEWDKIFNTEEGLNLAGLKQNITSTNIPVLPEEEIKKLKEGIDKLTVTAGQFAGLSEAVSSTSQFVKTIDTATQTTGKFISSQEILNSSAEKLNSTYLNISSNTEIVDKSTKAFAVKIDDINKNLSSINSVYEIHLKNIQVQSEGINSQTESLKTVTDELALVLAEIQKIKNASLTAASETEKFKSSAEKLSNQVAELNSVYGNMLNAFNS